MAIVNDFLSAVNQQLGTNIPLLPLDGFPAVVKTIWNFALSNWQQGDALGNVSLDITKENPLSIPLGTGEVSVTEASIDLATKVK